MLSGSVTGNPLPKRLSEAAVVPYEDSFLLVGGTNNLGPPNSDQYFGDVYRYDAGKDEWAKLEGSELRTPRSDHVALLVPQSLFPECNSNNKTSTK